MVLKDEEVIHYRKVQVVYTKQPGINIQKSSSLGY